MKYCMCFGKRKLILWFWLWYEAQYRNKTAHDRTDDIEKAEWQIYECRDAEHGALCHAASRPWHQHGGYRSGILGTTAQQFWTITSLLILFLVDGGIHDDGEELVTHHQIEQHTGCYRRTNERHSAVDALQEYASDGMEHVAGHHT